MFLRLVDAVLHPHRPIQHIRRRAFLRPFGVLGQETQRPVEARQHALTHLKARDQSRVGAGENRRFPSPQAQLAIQSTPTDPGQRAETGEQLHSGNIAQFHLIDDDISLKGGDNLAAFPRSRLARTSAGKVGAREFDDASRKGVLRLEEDLRRISA